MGMRISGICQLLFSFLAVLPLAAQPPSQCAASAGASPAVRAEGLSELVGDIVINCLGGIPTLAGQPVPKVNIFLRGKAPVGNPIYQGSYNDSFLIIGQPDSGNQVLHDFSQMLDLIGVGGASGLNFDIPSSAGNMGQRVPNVFQGRQSGRNDIVWLGIPFDPPGTVATRIIRITNVRANASLLAQSGINSIVATVSSPELGINTDLNLASILPMLEHLGTGNAPHTQVLNAGVFTQNANVNTGLPALSPLPQPSFTIRLVEGFPNAFKTRTSAQGNLTNPFPAPADHSRLGAPLVTETGFHNPAFPGGLGLADYGTRLGISFAGVPPGVQVFLSNNSAAGSSPSVLATILGKCVGPASPAASTNGLVEVPITMSGLGSVCAEIIRQDPNVREVVVFNGWIGYAGASNPVAPSIILTNVGPAPNLLTPASNLDGPQYLPRFYPPTDPIAAYSSVHGVARIRAAEVPSNIFQQLRTSAFAAGTFTGFQGSVVIHSTNSIIATAGNSVPTTVTPILRGGPSAAREATAGWLTVNQSQSMTPLTLNIQANPAGLAPGTYEAGIRLQSPPPDSLSAEIPIRLIVLGPGPRFAANGVAGAADYYAGGVAAGQAIVAYGSGYGPPELALPRLDEQGRVATTLAETRVLFDGAPAPLALRGQRTGQCPRSIRRCCQARDRNADRRARGAVSSSLLACPRHGAGTLDRRQQRSGPGRHSQPGQLVQLNGEPG